MSRPAKDVFFDCSPLLGVEKNPAVQERERFMLVKGMKVIIVSRTEQIVRFVANVYKGKHIILLYNIYLHANFRQLESDSTSFLQF